MAFTYHPNLETDLDWVRFLVGDNIKASARLQDEEISALLSAEPNKYYAAAEALLHIVAQWNRMGIAEKRVDDLWVKFSLGQPSAEKGVMARVAELRERGAEDLTASPKRFRIL